MTVFDRMSQESAGLIFAALDYAVENAGISEDGFTPFAFLEGPDGRRMTRFVAGKDLRDCLAAGREALRVVEAGVTCVALAWDGYWTDDDGRSEAVLVEGYEIGQERSVLLVQRYARRGGDVVTEGNPALIDEPAPLVQSRRP